MIKTAFCLEYNSLQVIQEAKISILHFQKST